VQRYFLKFAICSYKERDQISVSGNVAFYVATLHARNWLLTVLKFTYLTSSFVAQLKAFFLFRTAWN